LLDLENCLEQFLSELNGSTSQLQSRKGFLLDATPLENKNTTASPLATDWQNATATATARRTSLARRFLVRLSFFLFFFYLSLDVGLCDDIPLMAARFFFLSDCSSILFSSLLFLSSFQDFYGRTGTKRVWMSGYMGEGSRGKKRRRYTRMSNFFVPPFFPIFLGSLAVEGKRKSVQWDLLFGGVCVCV
jgi:hypothetical protein